VAFKSWRQSGLVNHSIELLRSGATLSEIGQLLLSDVLSSGNRGSEAGRKPYRRAAAPVSGQDACRSHDKGHCRLSEALDRLRVR